ncbi:MAG: DUF2142 domain-containing protein [Thermoleophilaceae bacterium]|nr:DUF2142 domain-containing protein [Thermoleophilaceae bacterium]
MLLSCFLALGGVAWLMATPPGSAPDEGAHYVKALATGRGDLYGDPPVPTAGERKALFGIEGDDLATLAQAAESSSARWQRRTTRQFDLPRSLAAPTFGCTFFDEDRTGACVDESPPLLRRKLVTYTGTYQPYVYVLPGLAMRGAHSPQAALRLGRLAVLALSAALLIAAVWVLWTPAAPWLSLLGFLAATTPMVLYLASVLNPSGPEVAAAICFAAALIRLSRPGGRPPRWLWAVLAAAGVTLASARALGPAFVVLDAAAVALLGGWRPLWNALRSGGRWAAAAVAATAVAAAANLAWEFVRQPRPEPSATSLADALRPAFDGLNEVGRQAVGVFGSLDAPMPEPAYWVWGVLIVALLAAAAAVGTRRDRVAAGALAAGAVLATLVMSLVYREIGPLHGRYALPLLVLVPLWAGEILLRRRQRLQERTWRGVFLGVVAVSAVVHLVGWWTNGRRFAVGAHGDWVFLGDPAWRPPLGWFPWLAAMVAASALLAAVGLAARRLPMSADAGAPGTGVRNSPPP